MNSSPLFWSRRDTPPELHPILEVLSRDYPLSEGDGRPELRFIPAGQPGALRVRRGDAEVTVEFGSIPAALRGIGHALAGTNADASSSFDTLGIMLDCSRNAVMTVPHVKRWLLRLALLGYNMLMLYTEDTYQLPGEPFFGYMRGAYTLEEIKEIDAYAASLGIQVVACIQTLGHLEQILKWNHYHRIRDTSSVLLADGVETYLLIDKIIRFWAGALGSRRIHVGMDETHDLGRGRFMDKLGYKPPFETFNRHLSRVTRLCENYGLKPMIWSDMYFRMGNPNQDYYDRNTVIPDEVRDKIPKSVQLVYWDYYNADEDFYTEWIKRHRDLGYDPIMASGIWTWGRFWYDHPITASAVIPCLNACRKSNVRELLFTLWGDGGAFCEFDSAFAGLAWAADLSYGGKGEDADVAPLLKAICESDYETLLLGSGIEVAIGGDRVQAATVLWDDPLLGIGWHGYLFAGKDFWFQVLDKLIPIREKLTPQKDAAGEPDLGYLWHLCNVMILKIRFREALVTAYRAKDRDALLRLTREEIPQILTALTRLEAAFRRQWLRRNKPFGMEVIQTRFGAQSARFRETSIRIGEWLEGKISSIEELEAQPEKLGKNTVSAFNLLATGSLYI